MSGLVRYSDNLNGIGKVGTRRIVEFVARHNRTLAYALSATVVFHLGFYAAQVL